LFAHETLPASYYRFATVHCLYGKKPWLDVRRSTNSKRSITVGQQYN
jgi:hypothetical protein